MSKGSYKFHETWVYNTGVISLVSNSSQFRFSVENRFSQKSIRPWWTVERETRVSSTLWWNCVASSVQLFIHVRAHYSYVTNNLISEVAESPSRSVTNRVTFTSSRSARVSSRIMAKRDETYRMRYRWKGERPRRKEARERERTKTKKKK